MRLERWKPGGEIDLKGAKCASGNCMEVELHEKPIEAERVVEEEINNRRVVSLVASELLT
jgi:hypothetical protein